VVILGVLILVRLGVRQVDVVIKGDSKSALSWMDKGKVSGKAEFTSSDLPIGRIEGLG